MERRGWWVGRRRIRDGERRRRGEVEEGRGSSPTGEEREASKESPREIRKTLGIPPPVRGGT